MENNLYYTPTIEEFHVGFEYELLGNSGNWYKNDFGDANGEYWNELSECYWDITHNKLRVKYLDQEDIESLGWNTEDNGECYNLQIKWDLYGLYPFEFESKIPHTYKICKDTKDLFYGTIKNKSELKKLMQQLNIK